MFVTADFVKLNPYCVNSEVLYDIEVFCEIFLSLGKESLKGIIFKIQVAYFVWEVRLVEVRLG
jgi:hypothetical protein